MAAINRHRVKPALLLLAAGMVSSCASGVYLHSPSLEASTSKAAAAWPSEADTLKPFDDQLANLATFADTEDLAAAKFWTTFRDEHFTQIIAVSSRAQQQVIVRRQIDKRLDALLGVGVRSLPADRLGPAADLADELDLAAARRRGYQRAEEAEFVVQKRSNPQAKLVRHDLTCNAVIAEVPQSNEASMVFSRDPKTYNLGALAGLCRRIAVKTVDVDKIDASLSGTSGLLKGELEKAQKAEDETQEKLSDRAQALAAAITKADKWSKTESNLARLSEFREEIESILDDASLATKAVGWADAADLIDELLLAKVCDASAVSEADKKAAGCEAVKDDSTTGQVQAVWGLARALATLSDLNATDRRAAGWLLAARAIVAAEKANATLEAEKAKLLAVAHRRRADLLLIEARYLIDARQSAVAARGGCSNAGLSGADSHCMLAAYLDAWNYGRIPAGVLAYTPIQIERAYAVRRARVVAQKERALASAGLTTLKDYGAGGLTAAIIAQALFDGAVLGGVVGD